MIPWMFFLSLITFVYLVYLLIEFVIGFSQIKSLTKQIVSPGQHFPSLSIILSALNEENNIEEVLNSFGNLNYPDFEIIVINDRSTDQTPVILEKLQKKYSQLIKVHHIDHLPEGWLGKNHALHFASLRARGEWLLFTDADVTMHEDTLLKAVSYVLENKVDHLTVFELLYRKYFWFKISLLSQYVYYCLALKPWRVRYQWSKKFLGRGAFNLVKKESYQKSGGHQAIAMECLDDMSLGKLLKNHGYSQHVAEAQDFVKFKWYGSLREMIAGLEKNAFTFRNYRLFVTMSDIFFALVFFIWPVISAIFFSGWAQKINLLNVTLTVLISAFVATRYRIPKRYALFYPFGMMIILYTVWNSVVMTYKNKGVIWRGTHYPLEKLREQSL